MILALGWMLKIYLRLSEHLALASLLSRRSGLGFVVAALGFGHRSDPIGVHVELGDDWLRPRGSP